MLGTDPEPDQTGRNPAQEREGAQQLERQGR